MTQDQAKASLTVDDILSIGRRAMDKCHGTEAQHIYIAREVERRLQAAAQAAPQPAQAVPDAVKTLIASMRSDPDYAWSWHCNVAMSFVDAGGDHYTANQGAARFMRLFAGVDPAHSLPAAPQPEAQATTNSYRKKPVVIEAIQWDGTESGVQLIKAHFPAIETLAKGGYLKEDRVTRWRIGTLEGGHDVSSGDWIIKGIKGEFYPCKPDIFAATYEPAAPSAQAEQAAQATAPGADPVAVRYDFDGYGWKYIDNGSGSDWMTRHPDGELLYDGPATAAGDGWISVRDRLPPKFEEVLVAFEGISLASTGQYTDNARDKHGWCYPAENYGTCDDGSDPVVTHWMPLPTAPGFVVPVQGSDK